MKINWKLIISIILIIAVAWLGVEVIKEELRTRYVMSDGVICKSSTITGGIGSATHEFYHCSNGKRYINPETYEKRKTKRKYTFQDAILGVDE